MTKAGPVWSLVDLDPTTDEICCSCVGATQLFRGLHGLCFTHGVIEGLIPKRDDAKGPG